MHLIPTLTLSLDITSQILKLPSRGKNISLKLKPHNCCSLSSITWAFLLTGNNIFIFSFCNCNFYTELRILSWFHEREPTSSGPAPVGEPSKTSHRFCICTSLLFVGIFQKATSPAAAEANRKLFPLSFMLPCIPAQSHELLREARNVARQFPRLPLMQIAATKGLEFSVTKGLKLKHVLQD